MADQVFTEKLLITGSERPGHIEVSMTLFRVVDEMPVRVEINARLAADDKRTVQQLRKQVGDLALSAIRTL
jgi:hypothetical protein